MQSLPNEIVAMIVNNEKFDAGDVGAVRLTCKYLHPFASERLVRSFMTPLPLKFGRENFSHLYRVASTPSFAPFVRSISETLVYGRFYDSGPFQERVDPRTMRLYLKHITPVFKNIQIFRFYIHPWTDSVNHEYRCCYMLKHMRDLKILMFDLRASITNAIYRHEFSIGSGVASAFASRELNKLYIKSVNITQSDLTKIIKKVGKNLKLLEMTNVTLKRSWQVIATQMKKHLTSLEHITIDRPGIAKAVDQKSCPSGMRQNEAGPKWTRVECRVLWGGDGRDAIQGTYRRLLTSRVVYVNRPGWYWTEIG